MTLLVLAVLLLLLASPAIGPWWVPVAIAAAGAASNAYGRTTAQGRRKRQYQRIRDLGGLANSAPEYGAAAGSLAGQNEGVQGYLGNLLKNFQGRPEDMQIAMERLRPFMGAMTSNTKAFQDLQNYGQLAAQLPSQTEMMQGYGNAAGRQAQASAQGYQQARGALGNMGLGNSAAMASLAGQHAASLSSNQSDLYSKMYQASLQQRVQNAQLQNNWAARAYDAQQQIAQMTMGAGTPRAPQQETNLWGPIAQTAGQAIGSYFAGSGSKGSTPNVNYTETGS